MLLTLVSPESTPLQPASGEAEREVREGASEIFAPSFNMSALLSVGVTCCGNTTDPAFFPSLSFALFFPPYYILLVECGI